MTLSALGKSNCNGGANPINDTALLLNGVAFNSVAMSQNIQDFVLNSTVQGAFDEMDVKCNGTSALAKVGNAVAGAASAIVSGIAGALGGLNNIARR
jgi:hypothetical protein